MNDSTAETTENWWQRLSGGLKRSSSALGGAIAHLVANRQLDAATIGAIEDELIRADLGTETADRIATELRYGRFKAAITGDEIKAVVAAEVEKALTGVAQPLAIDAAKKPFVVFVAGVNGSGKTTTIGKLAAKFRDRGPLGHAGGRRHVSRGGHRSTENLGGAQRRRFCRARSGRRRRGRRVRRGRRGQGRAASTFCSSIPPAVCRTAPN